MESGEDREAKEPSRTMTGWTMALTCVAIVACGVIVSGLLHKPEPELTTAPVPVTKPAPEVDRTYVRPSVVFPVDIPGCDVVDPPGDGKSTGYAAIDKFGYDNPAYPWFSGPKAVAMSRALQDALPDGVDLPFASLEQSLFFRPIVDPDTGSGEHPDFGGWTTASSGLLRGGKTGDLIVSVRKSAAPIPHCVAGDLDERRHLADGTTVDVHDTWYQVGKVRTRTRSADAYLIDGTVVTTYATDAGQNGSSHSGTVPLTVDELAAIATAPGLRVTASVPSGTPDVPESCGTWPEIGGTKDKDAGKIDEDAARRLNAVLAQIPLDGLTLDRPLGQLRPANMASGVCQVVRITTPGRQSRLSVAITVGQRPPEQPMKASEFGGDRVTSRQLPDGTVVENRESRNMKTPNQPDAQPVSETIRTVTTTRKSGTRVEVRSTAVEPADPLSFEQLESIAVNPGLEVR
ncbi:hypothetical protein ABZ942_29505 [Nocardia sp. NPDC046473]|uniref:hypothetical protein n=1 Tax=Nocardia sp. NPDC046473 TaxID=3155733 RepID=UPI0033D1ECAE